MSEIHHVVTTCDRCGYQYRTTNDHHDCSDPDDWIAIYSERMNEGKRQFFQWHLCPACAGKLFADMFTGPPWAQGV